MMQPTHADDALARSRALDAGRSFIVRAPAGSGKTRLLIQRYLALLSTVDEPEEIVAITFTRKAAAEMRERVLQALAQAGQSRGDSDKITRAHALAVLECDARRGWQLAGNASRLRILTIDALNATITRQMPLAARFGAQPENIEDATPLYEEAARALLAEVNATGPIADDVALLLDHLDNDLASAGNLLAVMLRTRDHWLRSLGRMNEREALEQALRRVRADAMREVAQRFPDAEKQETLELARFSGQNRPESVASPGVLPGTSAHTWPVVDEASMPAWIALADLLLTAGGTWRKRGGVNKNLGFPGGENKEEKAFFAPWKARMGDLLERLAAAGEEDVLAAALHRLRDLPADRYSESQWQVLGAILRLLPVATAMLWTVFGERGQCDFVEVAQSASRALGDDDAPTDLAIALDHRIRHLLVDEFQDTSFAQFELLERLTRGWSPGDGRSFFAVGDPMQSIYRFREAEVALFLRAMRRGIGELTFEPLELGVNFRCSAGVVEWINQTFRVLMPPTEDVDAGRVPYAASVAASAVGGGPADAAPAVTWHPLHVRSGQAAAAEAIEAGTVVRIVRATRQENPSASIALLVRNRSHLAQIVPALKEASIAFRAVDIDPLGERPVVQDLLALTRALLHPADRIAWLAVLRAPWCGLTLADLAALAGGARPVEGALRPDARTIWELLGDADRMADLSTDGRARAAVLREILAPAMSASRRRPLRELVEAAWLGLRGPACLPQPGDLDDARRLLDAIEAEAKAQSGGADIADLAPLQARVDRLFAAPAAGGDPTWLQIMTIHKAKGLEFDTVIVPGLHRGSRQDERKLLVWSEQPDPCSGAREILLAPIRESGGDEEADAIYRCVLRLDRERQQHEDVRLLYVAATRARRRIHWLAAATLVDGDGGVTLRRPRRGSLLAALWPVAEAAFAAPAAQPGAGSVRPDGAPHEATESRLLAGQLRLSRQQERPELAPAVPVPPERPMARQRGSIEFDWAGETARHVGTAVHAFLQIISQTGAADWPRDRLAGMHAQFAAELARLGVAEAERTAAVRRVFEALANAVESERGRWLLAGHREARCEWRLSGADGEDVVNVAIDRSFIDDAGTRWIVDYKTGSHSGADPADFLDNEQRRYRLQLEQYAALVHALDAPPRPIRLGLYFPLMNGWREWAWEPA